MDAFFDPNAVARYVDNPRRLMSGYTEMQGMAMLLLGERNPWCSALAAA